MLVNRTMNTLIAYLYIKLISKKLEINHLSAYTKFRSIKNILHKLNTKKQFTQRSEL